MADEYENGYDEEEDHNIVIDIGTGYLKCGFAGDDSPRAVFKNMIATPRADSVGLVHGSSGDSGKVFVGEDAAANASVCDVRYPCENGIVTDPDALKYVLEQAMVTELRVEPKDYFVLLTEAPLNPDKNRQQMIEMLFEHFQVRGAQVQIQAVLALYASGRTTGLVFDSGDGVSHTVPVFKGYGIKHAVGSSQTAGREVSKRTLEVLATDNGIDLRNESNGLEIAREIKENVCKVALDYESELHLHKNDPSYFRKYELRDGQVIECKLLIVEPPEILFQPQLFGHRKPSVKQVLEVTVKNVNIDTRKDLFRNTVLSGGTTCLREYVPRFKKEYVSIVPENSKGEVNVFEPSDRTSSVFMGGSILASLNTFRQQWITREEWAEKGVEILNQKRLF